MKKLLALILAAALALSLVACGGGSGAGDTNTPSTPSGGNGDTTSTDTPSGGGEDSTDDGAIAKEEMIKQATEYDLSDINNDTIKNIVSAKQEYCGKTILTKAQIREITLDHITIGSGSTNVEIYLPDEDIAKLEKDQFVTIVGNMGDEIVSGQLSYTYKVSPAYLVADRYEYTGTPKSKNDDYNGAWNVEFPGNSVLQLVYFDESIDINQYIDKEIKFTAKAVGWNFYDALIIE